MKVKKLFEAIGNVDDALVEEAVAPQFKKKHTAWKQLFAVAACAALVVGSVLYFPQHTTSALADVVFPKAYAFDDYDAKRDILTDNPVEDDFINSVNQFSYQTAVQIFKEQDGNLQYSPLSLYYALALAASGAEGDTAAELFALLGVSDRDFLSAQCGNLYRRLYTDNQIGALKIADSIWMDDSVAWKDGFVRNAAENFYASAFSMDFSDGDTAKSMEKWIAEMTDGVLSPSIEMSAEQILSIINTVYFKDQWVDEFDKSRTKEDTFYTADGRTVQCDFMHSQYSSAAFTKGDGFVRSSLPLKNGGRMVFILPDEGTSPRALLTTPERMQAVFTGGESICGKVIWQIPKFGFATSLELANVLQVLGVHAAFRENANFGGITDTPAYISGIRQDTHIAIDEKGVEAAAFTQIDYAGASPPTDKAEMILNRPFLYGITAADGTLLFVGICENPAAQ